MQFLDGFRWGTSVKKGIKNRTAFAENIGKDFKKALKDLSVTKDLI